MGHLQDDGGHAALHLRRHFEDSQSAGNARVEDIMEAYLQAWKLGLKAVAIYRDGCKKSQPLSPPEPRPRNQKGDASHPAVPQQEQDTERSAARYPSPLRR